MSRQYDAWVQQQLEPDQELRHGRKRVERKIPEFDFQAYYEKNRRYIEMEQARMQWREEEEEIT